MDAVTRLTLVFVAFTILAGLAAAVLAVIVLLVSSPLIVLAATCGTLILAGWLCAFAARVLR